MRVLFFILLYTGLVGSCFGQDNENQWFESSKSYGGFGGVTLNYGLNQNVFIGGEGAFRIKNYYFGGFGHGTDIGTVSSVIAGKSFDVQFGEGGVLLGAISNTNSKWALMTDVKIGFGELVARAQLSDNIFEEYESTTISVSPRVGITFSPIEIIQIKLFAGYSFFNNTELTEIASVPLENPQFGLSLYLGYFR